MRKQNWCRKYLELQKGIIFWRYDYLQMEKILTNRLMNTLLFWHFKYVEPSQRAQHVIAGASVWELHFKSSHLRHLLLGEIYLKNLINSTVNIGSLTYTISFHTEQQNSKTDTSSKGNKLCLSHKKYMLTASPFLPTGWKGGACENIQLCWTQQPSHRADPPRPRMVSDTLRVLS